MRFLISSRYLSPMTEWRAEIHLGTWPSNVYRPIGPVFKTYAEAAAHIKRVRGSRHG